MSYMESAMQDKMDGAVNLQNAICDDACDIYMKTGIMPLDMKAQRDELLEILEGVLLMGRGSSGRIIIEGWQEDSIRLSLSKLSI